MAAGPETERPAAAASSAPRAPLAPPVPAMAAAHGAALPWSNRLRDLVSSYLPLLLMAVLALGTWWLVKNAPVLEATRPAAEPTHVPDYTMSTFTVRRFAADGHLRAQIEGDVMRHYPDTDTIEVDNPHIRAYAPDGRLTLATARRALSNGDGTEVQLLGGAQVVREATAREEATEFRGEFLHAFFNTDELRSHLPVVVTRGATELRASGLDYKHLDQRLQLSGRVHATLPPAGTRRVP